MAKDSLRFLDKDEVCECNILDKTGAINYYVSLMLNRTNRMMEYDDLPSTMPATFVERILQVHGSAGVLEHKGDLYMIVGGLGGEPDVYHRGTIYTVASPALMLNENMYRVVNHLQPYTVATWEKYPPCVFCRNDTMAMGLTPIFARYATQLTENEISIRAAQINSRSQTIISAVTGPEVQSANQYMSNLEAGKLSTVAQRPFLDGIKVLSGTGGGTGGTNIIMQLIELQQYLKASWYNEIGLNSNFNMKREYLSADEIQAATDIMLPLVDDMLLQRQIWVEAVNKQWGLKIKVRKSSAWEDKQNEADLTLVDGQYTATAKQSDANEPIQVNLGTLGTTEISEGESPIESNTESLVDETTDIDSPEPSSSDDTNDNTNDQAQDNSNESSTSDNTNDKTDSQAQGDIMDDSTLDNTNSETIADEVEEILDTVSEIADTLGIEEVTEGEDFNDESENPEEND